MLTWSTPSSAKWLGTTKTRSPVKQPAPASRQPVQSARTRRHVPARPLRRADPLRTIRARGSASCTFQRRHGPTHLPHAPPAPVSRSHLTKTSDPEILSVNPGSSLPITFSLEIPFRPMFPHHDRQAVCGCEPQHIRVYCPCLQQIVQSSPHEGNLHPTPTRAETPSRPIMPGHRRSP